jgi:hypothetical protein
MPPALHRLSPKERCAIGAEDTIISMSPVRRSHRTDESGDASWVHECNAFLLALQEGNCSEVVPTLCRIHESGVARTA